MTDRLLEALTSMTRMGEHGREIPRLQLRVGQVVDASTSTCTLQVGSGDTAATYPGIATIDSLLSVGDTVYWLQTQSGTGVVLGRPGSIQAGRLRPSGTAGAPALGNWVRGDMAIDSTGRIWVCTLSGSPGTWDLTAAAMNWDVYSPTAGGYSITSSDAGRVLVSSDTTAADYTIMTGGALGQYVRVVQGAAGAITIIADVGVTQYDDGTPTTSAQWTYLDLICIGTNEWVVLKAGGGGGSVGATGPSGPPGATGATGPAGAGATGATGPAGASGTPGGVGATGPGGGVGATGPAGGTGGTGGTGGPGGVGATGPAGGVGATGPAGGTGGVGATGATGAAGAGSDALKIWMVQNLR